MQDLGHDALRAKDGDEILLAEIIGVHQGAKHFHWRSVRDGIGVVPIFETTS